MQTRTSLILAIVSLMAFMNPLAAQALELGQASGSLGFVSAGSVSLGFNVDILKVTNKLYLNAGLKYWQYSWDDPWSNAVSLTTRDIILNPRLLFRHNLSGSKLSLFGGGGAALHVIRVSGHETIGTPSSGSATGPTFDINLGGGLDYAISEKVGLGAELNIHTGGVSFTEFAVRSSFRF